MKRNKLLGVLLLIITSIIGILYLSFYRNPHKEPDSTFQTSETEQQTKEQVSILIDFGDGKVITGSIDHQENLSAFDALSQLVDRNAIEMQTQQYDFGVFVKSIGSKESSEKKAWIYFVNKESGQVAADLMKLSPNDSVEWKYLAPTTE